MTDCFYLPYEFGDSAQVLLDTIDFLFANEPCAWGERWVEFQLAIQACEKLLVEINNISNREMLYALYGPVWMLREEMSLTHKVLQWKFEGSKDECTSVYHLPKTYRGALTDNLQKYFHLNDKGILRPIE